LNSKLKKQNLDGYAVAKTSIIQKIDLSVVALESSFKDMFVAQQGLMKFYGRVIV
jgi:hypothetical protein